MRSPFRLAMLFASVATLLVLQIAAAVRADGPEFAGAPVGLQLYSLRGMMAGDIPGTLARVRKMGFTDVEMASMYNHSAGEWHRMLDYAGLTCSSMHTSYVEIGSDVPKVIRNAKTVGAKFVVVPWIPHAGPFTESVAHSAAANFDRWGAELAKHGLHFGYHPHGYEFEPTGNGTLFDVLVSETKKENCNFELDVFWALHAGQDPVALMKKYPDRFPLLHLKDMQRGVRTGIIDGSLPVKYSVVLGQGQLDMPGLAKESAAIHVTESYIEDENENAIKQIPLSLDYLKSMEK